MPAPKFTVHVDPDDLARQNLAAAVGNHPTDRDGSTATGSAATDKHGKDDTRLAARQRSEQARAGRATAGTGRTYAFRRS